VKSIALPQTVRDYIWPLTCSFCGQGGFMKGTVVCTLVLAATVVFAQTPDTNANQSAQDRQFVDRAAQLNMTEAHMAQLAEQKSSSPAVKDFAQTLQRDHTQAYQQLGSIARQDGFTLPNGIDQQHQQEIQPLQSLSGRAFDQKFQSMEVNDHQQAIDWVRNAQNSLQNQNLKNYASQMLNTLQKHLEMAKALSTNQTTGVPSQPGNNAGAVGANSAMNSGNSADRYSSTPETAGQNGAAPASEVPQQNIEHGTVTAYTPGQRLQLKVRGRLGRHSYNLNSVVMQNNIQNLKVGDRVTVTEMMDQNGRRTIHVERDQNQ
jgi:predicted outer membrane protein